MKDKQIGDNKSAYNKYNIERLRNSSCNFSIQNALSKLSLDNSTHKNIRNNSQIFSRVKLMKAQQKKKHNNNRSTLETIPQVKLEKQENFSENDKIIKKILQNQVIPKKKEKEINPDYKQIYYEKVQKQQNQTAQGSEQSPQMTQKSKYCQEKNVRRNLAHNLQLIKKRIGKTIGKIYGDYDPIFGVPNPRYQLKISTKEQVNEATDQFFNRLDQIKLEKLQGSSKEMQSLDFDELEFDFQDIPSDIENLQTVRTQDGSVQLLNHQNSCRYITNNSSIFNSKESIKSNQIQNLNNQRNLYQKIDLENQSSKIFSKSFMKNLSNFQNSFNNQVEDHKRQLSIENQDFELKQKDGMVEKLLKEESLKYKTRDKLSLYKNLYCKAV